MGTALISGILAAGQLNASQVSVVELNAERRATLESELPGVQVTNELQPTVNTVIATKPDSVTEVARAVAQVGTQRILSVAAGISTSAIAMAAAANAGTNLNMGNTDASNTDIDSPVPVVLRCMPNTPALVRNGAIGLCGGEQATETDLKWAAELLGAVGLVVQVDESQLDAVTGLSGSGPAYFYLVVEALIQGGIEAGLSPVDAHQLTIQTMHGAALLLQEPGADPAQLREAVTSPNGTTAAGLRTLEEHGARAAFTAAVAAATQRAQELGQ